MKLGRRRQRQRGYTMVELMMALAIFMVAAVGIFSMQKVAANTNAHAKNLAIAQRLAQATAAQLQMDSTQWKATLAGNWLTQDDQWHRLRFADPPRFGSAFDGLGTALISAAGARFCSNVRMAPLFTDASGRSANGLLRVEIRVYWVRDNATPLAAFCNEDDSILAKLGQSPDIYLFAYQTVAVRQHLI